MSTIRRTVFISNTRQHLLKDAPAVLTKLRQISKDGDEIWLIIFDHENNSSTIEKMSKYGAHHVLVYQMTEIDAYNLNDLLQVGRQKYNWNTFIFMDDYLSRQTAGILSTQTEAAYIADCIDINYCNMNEKWEYHRTALNDSSIAKIISINTKIEVCVIKNNAFSLCKSFEAASITHISCSFNNNKNRNHITVLDKKRNEQNTDNMIGNTKCVFGFGRGINLNKKYTLLKDIANLCGAKIGMTKAIIEESENNEFQQIGQSGISIAPNIYIAFGISGATQHLAGVKNAKILIAVNNDPQARIFEYADYIVVQDAEVILDELYKLVIDNTLT